MARLLVFVALGVAVLLVGCVGQPTPEELGYEEYAKANREQSTQEWLHQQGEPHSKGALLYYSYCAKCHTIDVQMTGPPLRDAHLRRSREALIAWVMAANKRDLPMGASGLTKIDSCIVLREGEEIGLGRRQIQHIVDYVEVESRRHTDTTWRRPQ